MVLTYSWFTQPIIVISRPIVFQQNIYFRPTVTSFSLGVAGWCAAPPPASSVSPPAASSSQSSSRPGAVLRPLQSHTGQAWAWKYLLASPKNICSVAAGARAAGGSWGAARWRWSARVAGTSATWPRRGRGRGRWPPPPPSSTRCWRCTEQYCDMSVDKY